MCKIKHPVWQPYSFRLHACLPVTLTAWMLHSGSFIQNLKNHGVASPQVKVIHQAWQFPTRDEREILALGDRRYSFIREVLIHHDGVPLMYARSVFPSATLTGKEKSLAKLKNRSLGSMLFSNPHTERSEFELACLTPEMPTYQKILRCTPIKSKQVWARRSVFYIENKPLLLEEVFLPSPLFVIPACAGMTKSEIKNKRSAE